MRPVMAGLPNRKKLKTERRVLQQQVNRNENNELKSKYPKQMIVPKLLKQEQSIKQSPLQSPN